MFRSWPRRTLLASLRRRLGPPPPPPRGYFSKWLTVIPARNEQRTVARVVTALVRALVSDDLLLAVFRRRAEQGLERQAQALTSGQPLRALWQHSTDARDTTLIMEFTGLANTREAIRSEIARYAERSRLAQVEALSGLFAEGGLPSRGCSPEVLTVLLTSVSRVMIMEQALGMTIGHAETLAFVEQWLRRLEGEPASPGPAAGEA
jgi:hypothetical protein